MQAGPEAHMGTCHPPGSGLVLTTPCYFCLRETHSPSIIPQGAGRTRAKGKSPQPGLAAFVQSTRDQGFTLLLILVQSARVQQEMIPLPTSLQIQSTPSDNTEGEWGWEGEGREGTSLRLRMASATPAATLPHQDLYMSISISCVGHQTDRVNGHLWRAFQTDGVS